MKKKIALTVSLLLIVAAALAFENNRGNAVRGNIANVKRTASASEAYSEQEIHDAMDIVAEYFQDRFQGCTLTDLWYEESASVPETDGWAKQYDAEESMVLLSNFDVDSSGGDGSLDPNTTYSDWQWILVRNKGGKWDLKTWGYG